VVEWCGRIKVAKAVGHLAFARCIATSINKAVVTTVLPTSHRTRPSTLQVQRVLKEAGFSVQTQHVKLGFWLYDYQALICKVAS